MTDDRAAEEARLSELCADGRYDQTAEGVLRAYGREVYEFLAALHRNEADTAEVFSMFAEALWKSLERFEGKASFRTWAYAVARRCSLRYRRDARRRRARVGSLPEGSALSILADKVRTETVSFLKTEKRTRIQELRLSLPEEDQALLMLRVDRGLAWVDLARVLHEGDEKPLDDEALKKESARLRKRFQLVKEKLYELGRKEGLA